MSKKTSVSEYTELIENDLAGLDIGIVCLNAGCMIQGPTDLTSDSDYERIINLNALHVAYFTKAILPHLMSRGSRSALLLTSSMLSTIPLPGLSMYTATKAFVTNFAEALHYEIRHLVDVTSWECGPTYTNLFGEGEE